VPTPSLTRAKVSGRLPAQDLARARRFYADVLGLEPVEERPGGLALRGRGRLLRPVHVMNGVMLRTARVERM
jgi:catechol 2,3-dioxygenase-like lactoylglutathione lyase family enzyme